jgi:hypothetical protein
MKLRFHTQPGPRPQSRQKHRHRSGVHTVPATARGSLANDAVVVIQNILNPAGAAARASALIT